MPTDVSNRTAVSASKNLADDRQPPVRDLRLEVLKLRGQLRDAEQLLRQHAVMLREGDHRIKNSLQLVASMIQLQARQETTAPASDALRAAAARISSVAGIHDALQAAEGTGLVNLGVTLRKLCASLHAMAGDKDHIEVVADVDELEVPVALARPAMLAVNELVSNALRHAFLDRDKGKVEVTLRRTDSGMRICISDDGRGLPAPRSGGPEYGTALVRMMVRQLGGTLVIESKSGACFTILAPLGRH